MVENRLREHREAVKMTQSELARRCRVASTNISAVEAGRVIAWPRLRKAISRVLKVPEPEIFPETVKSGQARR